MSNVFNLWFAAGDYDGRTGMMIDFSFITFLSDSLILIYSVIGPCHRGNSFAFVGLLPEVERY